MTINPCSRYPCGSAFRGIRYRAGSATDRSRVDRDGERGEWQVGVVARDDFAAVISTADRVMEDRNALVHGVLWSNADHTVIESQRPPRNTKEDSLSSDPNRPAWIKRSFSRRSLLALCNDCGLASGQIQVNLQRWASLLEGSVERRQT